jgi:hypothetical protein
MMSRRRSSRRCITDVVVTASLLDLGGTPECSNRLMGVSPSGAY